MTNFYKLVFIFVLRNKINNLSPLYPVDIDNHFLLNDKKNNKSGPLRSMRVFHVKHVLNIKSNFSFLIGSVVGILYRSITWYTTTLTLQYYIIVIFGDIWSYLGIYSAVTKLLIAYILPLIKDIQRAKSRALFKHYNSEK